MTHSKIPTAATGHVFIYFASMWEVTHYILLCAMWQLHMTISENYLLHGVTQWSRTACCEWQSHLQYCDVPCEALHRLVQLPALQPFLHGQVMEIHMKFHRWERKTDENECEVTLYGWNSWWFCETEEQPAVRWLESGRCDWVLSLLSLWGNTLEQRHWHVLSTFHSLLLQQKGWVSGSTVSGCGGGFLSLWCEFQNKLRRPRVGF